MTDKKNNPLFQLSRRELTTGLLASAVFTDATGKQLLGNGPGGVLSIPVQLSGGVLSLSPAGPNNLNENARVWNTTATVSQSGAPAYVQSNWAAGYSTQGSLLTLAQGFLNPQSAGDTNVVIVGWNATSTGCTVNDSAGNTYQKIQGPDLVAGPGSQAIFAAFNIKANASNTITAHFNPAVPNPDLRIAEYSGISTIDPATGAHASGTGSGTAIAVNIHIGTPNDIVVGGDYVGDAYNNHGSLWTNRLVTSPQGSNLQDGVIANPGTVSFNSTQGQSSWWITSAVAFQPQSGGGGGLSTQVEWAVFSAANVAYDPFVTVDLAIGANSNSCAIAATFHENGDYLKVNALPNTAITVNSGTCAIVPTPGPNSPVDMTGWSVLVYDPFPGTSLDSSIWRTYGHTASGTPPLTFDDAGIVVDNGLTCKIWNSSGTWFGPGMQTKGPIFGGTYAPVQFRAEFQALVPPAAGVGPFFAMIPDDGSIPPEFDLAEYPESKGTHANHFMATWHSDGNTSEVSTFYAIGSPATTPHTYTVEKTNAAGAAGFKYWVDGVPQTVPSDWGNNNDTTTGLAFGIGSVAFPPGSGGASWYGSTDGTTPNPYTSKVNYFAIWVKASAKTPLQKAYDFVADLTMGIWYSRGAQDPNDGDAVFYNNKSISDSTAGYCPYVKGTGVSHILLNYPFVANNGTGGQNHINGTPSTGDSLWKTQMSMAALANNAGLKVIHRFMDNMDLSAYSNGPLCTGWVTTASSWVRNVSGLDPAMNLFVPCGEMNGEDNATWSPHAQTFIEKMRAELPQNEGWLLGVPGAYWQSSERLLDSTGYRPVVNLASGGTDDQCIYMCETYLTDGDSGSGPYLKGLIDDWRAHSGARPVLSHEAAYFNGNFQSPSNPFGWIAGYNTLATTMGQYAPGCWSVQTTDGMFAQTDLPNAAFPADNYTALKNACTLIRQQSYYGKGNLR